jgi:hypothetical protein
VTHPWRRVLPGQITDTPVGVDHTGDAVRPALRDHAKDKTLGSGPERTVQQLRVFARQGHHEQPGQIFGIAIVLTLTGTTNDLHLDMGHHVLHRIQHDHGLVAALPGTAVARRKERPLMIRKGISRREV